jgi:hypothetical protein
MGMIDVVEVAVLPGDGEHGGDDDGDLVDMLRGDGDVDDDEHGC